MDRQIIYPGAIPLETDLLNTNKYAMIGISKLAAAILGTSTLLNGLACTPNSPADLTVKVAPGEIYSLQNIDGTAYSSLAADTTHQILKQGISLDTVTLSCPAPSTSGYSINYLVQIAYQDTDASAVVLPYYNASNPAQAYSGPNNSGTVQNTVRKGVCTVAVKAGVAATTGTQVTPAPDAGYIGAWVVTVANGQTTITSGNITQYSGAPFIPYTLTQLAPLASPAFTGTPVAPTPGQFDNSTKLATTAFVRTHLGMLRGENAYGTATTLTAADIGKEIYLIGSSSYTITLPLISASPAGSTIVFFSAANTSITIQRQGTDTIAGLASSTSVVIGVGDTLYLVSNGAAWVAYGGSAQIGNAAAFGSSLSGNGYQKLPSGLIVQWGGVTSSPSADVTWTFPIAFTTAMYVCVGTNANGAGSLSTLVSTGASTLTGVAVGAYVSNTGARSSATACQMIAIGK